MIRKALALVHAWLVIDFFAETRRTGQPGSSLTSTIFTQSFVALVFAALSFDSSIGLVAYASANLSLSTLLIGVGMLADPDVAERRAADRTLVSTAPVPRTLLPVARFLHATFHLGLVTVGTAIPPAVLAGFVAGTAWAVPAYLALAVVLAGTASGALALLVRLVLVLGGSVRAALVAGTVKALLLGGGLIAFALCLPHLDETADAIPGGRAAANAWPPYWASRLLDDPVANVVYGLAIAALAAALLAMALALGDPDDARSASRIGSRRPGPLGLLERKWAGSGPLLGVTEWTSAMLFRSPGFRARVLPLFGIPVAMALLAFGEQGTRERAALLGVTLQLPAIYLPFLVAFLPHADHAGAGWVFETSPFHSRKLAREAAVLSLAVRIMLPVQIVAGLAIAALGLGAGRAIALATFSFGLSVLVTAFATRRIEHVPFTADQDEPPELEFGGLVGISLALAALGIGFGLVAASPAGIAGGVASSALAAHFLSRAPRRVAAAFPAEARLR